MPHDRPISDIVLIVDDVPENLALLHDALDEAGYTVLVATNGESALQRAHKSLPDVVLLDAVMPGIDGFEVARRLKADYATHHIPIVFMDLAMPGIDGWETIRRIRRQQLGDAHIAVLSANAFDKNLDNDAGIAADDFIVKPLRVDELLDWIGRKLGLDWVSAETPATAAEQRPRLPAALVAPPPEYLAALDEMIGLGYVRGINGKLAEIEKLGATFGEFVRVLRGLARDFQFDAMHEVVRKFRNEH